MSFDWHQTRQRVHALDIHRSVWKLQPRPPDLRSAIMDFSFAFLPSTIFDVNFSLFGWKISHETWSSMSHSNENARFENNKIRCCKNFTPLLTLFYCSRDSHSSEDEVELETWKASVLRSSSSNTNFQFSIHVTINHPSIMVTRWLFLRCSPSACSSDRGKSSRKSITEPKCLWGGGAAIDFQTKGQARHDERLIKKHFITISLSHTRSTI